MKVNREILLQQLVSTSPGLSYKDLTDQSSCFVFSKGKVFTFNDEVACRQKCSLTFECAVPSRPLLELLGKLKEEELTFDYREEKKELVIIGKGRRSTIRVESDILLPLDKIEKPSGWTPLPEDFSDAVAIVTKCASKNAEDFALTCVHIHPEYLEACDNYQLARYPIETGITEPALVRGEAIRKAASLGMSHISETESWIHFKSKSDGLIVSCRVSRDEYHSLDHIYSSAKGKKTTLPKGLREAAEKAEIFSSENSDNNVVIIHLSAGMIQITGEGSTGWYSEKKKISYSGQVMKFLIQPGLLSEVVQRHNECQISEKYLIVSGGAFTYITCLSAVKEPA